MKQTEEIIVYWAPIGPASERGYLSFKEPEPVIKELKKLGNRLTTGDTSTNILKCPSVLSNIYNTFYISSPQDLKLVWKDNNLHTPERDQKFFDNSLHMKNIDQGFLTLPFTHIIFFTEEPSLVARQKTAIYSNNDFTKKTGLIEGSVNIGQWFRPFDTAIYMKEEGEVQIKSEDVLYYLEFLTDKKIVFKRFHANNLIMKFCDFCVNLKSSRTFMLKSFLQESYALFNRSRIKKQIIKEIKNNLLD